MEGRARLGLVLASALACGVRQEATSLGRDVPFACERDGDCPAGSCLADVGICTRATGRLEKLLFEVTPQASDPIYGGARFLKLLDPSNPTRDGAPLELQVRPRVPVTGRVLVAPELQPCTLIESNTLPVTLTFTPRETLYGVSLPSYEILTEFDAAIEVREYVFTGSIPPGRYDVYMRPRYEMLRDACRAIPQIFRDRSVGLMNGSDDRLELQQPPPSALRLSINWADNLEGWQLDMIHPVTGDVISNLVELHASDVDPNTNILSATLDYSREDPDLGGPANELVRLSPPPGALAGTVLLERSGIEIITSGEGVIGNVSSFGTPVAFQAWVWKRGEADAPVPGAVSFAAIELDDVQAGVTASFEAAANVDATGQVKTSLLPGRYRVRVTPPGLSMGNLGLMTGYETDVTVWPNGDPALNRQNGHVIDVPPALALRGQVVADTDGAPLRRVDVRASATHPARNRCGSQELGDAAAEACEPPRAPVLERALAQDPFIPRSRNGLSGGDGRFRIEGLDCGRCEPDAGTYFDLTVRPDVATGLPWVVRSAIDPVRDADALGATPIRIPMPVARPMRVTYGNEIVDPGGVDGGVVEDPSDAVPLPPRLSGALVRVFAILDDDGALVTRPETLVPCVSPPNPGTTRCLQSVIQVAEARTGSEGEFLLLLPPDVE